MTGSSELVTVKERLGGGAQGRSCNSSLLLCSPSSSPVLLRPLQRQLQLRHRWRLLRRRQEVRKPPDHRAAPVRPREGADSPGSPVYLRALGQARHGHLPHVLYHGLLQQGARPGHVPR